MKHAYDGSVPQLDIASALVQPLPEGCLGLKLPGASTPFKRFDSWAELEQYLLNERPLDVDVWELRVGDQTHYKVIDPLGGCYSYDSEDRFRHAMRRLHGQTWYEIRLDDEGSPTSERFVSAEQKGYWPLHSWTFTVSEAPTQTLAALEKSEATHRTWQQRIGWSLIALLGANGTQAQWGALLKPLSGPEASWSTPTALAAGLSVWKQPRLWPLFLAMSTLSRVPQARAAELALRASQRLATQAQAVPIKTLQDFYMSMLALLHGDKGLMAPVTRVLDKSVEEQSSETYPLSLDVNLQKMWDLFDQTFTTDSQNYKDSLCGVVRVDTGAMPMKCLQLSSLLDTEDAQKDQQLQAFKAWLGSLEEEDIGDLFSPKSESNGLQLMEKAFPPEIAPATMIHREVITRWNPIAGLRGHPKVSLSDAELSYDDMVQKIIKDAKASTSDGERIKKTLDEYLADVKLRFRLAARTDEVAQGIRYTAVKWMLTSRQGLREQFAKRFKAAYGSTATLSAKDFASFNDRLFAFDVVNLNAGGALSGPDLPLHAMLTSTLVGKKAQATFSQWLYELPAGKPIPDVSVTYDKASGSLTLRIGTKTPKCKPQAVLGRTVLCPLSKDVWYALKLLKAKEAKAKKSVTTRDAALEVFGDEYKSLAMLHGVPGFPEAKGVGSLDSASFALLSEAVGEGIAKEQARIKKGGDKEPPVRDIELSDVPGVFVYSAAPGYFDYLDGTGYHPLGEEERDFPVPFSESNAFETAWQNYFQQTLTLLQRGIGLYGLVGLTHTEDRGYNWMIGLLRMRYDLTNQGMGKVANWKGGARYTDLRLTGVADLGDHKLLGKPDPKDTEKTKAYYKYWGCPLQANADNDLEFTQTAAGKFMACHPRYQFDRRMKSLNLRGKFLLAQYFGNYLFNAFLVHTFRVLVLEKKASYQGEHKGRLAKELTTLFTLGFQEFLKQFGGETPLELLGQKTTSAQFVENLIGKDVETLVRQIHFFMGQPGHEAPEIVDQRQVDVDEGQSTSVALDDAFMPARSMRPGQPTVPLDLSRQQDYALTSQKAASGHLSALGPLGLCVYEQAASSTGSETSPALTLKERKVDLGFLNGPVGLPHLEVILYKLVGYGVMLTADMTVPAPSTGANLLTASTGVKKAAVKRSTSQAPRKGFRFKQSHLRPGLFGADKTASRTRREQGSDEHVLTPVP